MSGASAIAISKITNGTMIGQFGSAATRPRTQIILPLDLSPYDPSMKLGFSAPALRNGSKTLGARRLFSGCPWDSSQARDDFDLGRLRKHVERRDRIYNEFLVQLFQVARQCRGITRDVNQCGWRKIKNRIANSGAQASRRRIDNQGNSFTFEGRGD